MFIITFLIFNLHYLMLLMFILSYHLHYNNIYIYIAISEIAYVKVVSVTLIEIINKFLVF